MGSCWITARKEKWGKIYQSTGGCCACRHLPNRKSSLLQTQLMTRKGAQLPDYGPSSQLKLFLSLAVGTLSTPSKYSQTQPPERGELAGEQGDPSSAVTTHRAGLKSTKLWGFCQPCCEVILQRPQGTSFFWPTASPQGRPNRATPVKPIWRMLPPVGAPQKWEK